MPSVWTEYFEQQLLVDATTVVSSGSFHGAISAAQIEIFTNNFAIGPKTVYSDLTVPTYTGYAPITAAFAAPFRRREGGIAVNSAFVKFQQASTPTATTVYGIMITDGGSPPKLLAAEIIPGGPIALIDDLDALSVSAQLAIGGSDFGQSDFSN